MKKVKNQSPKACVALLNRAVTAGIDAQIIDKSKPRTRRYSSLGSTFAPQKVIILNDIRMSLGQAEQYIAARES